jgi:hypothetical protein
VDKLGPGIRLVVYRDRVAFMVRVRFAGAAFLASGLNVSFWLHRRLEHPRFARMETLTPTDHIYLVKVTEPEQIDTELLGWLREAYDHGR